ncbi:MAG: hypothetical protein ACE5EW_02240 [Thermoplasmata archaeon]
MAGTESVWSRRFFGAAIVQGGLVFVTMAIFLWLNLTAEPGQQPSRIVAGGSVGTWLLVGFTGYLILVVAVGLSAFFYHYVEVLRGSRYKGLNTLFAWAHLLFLNVGAIGATWLMMYAGYIGGVHLLTSSTLPPAVFGEVHALIEWTIYPIAGFILLGALGGLLGGLGYIRAHFGWGVRQETPMVRGIEAG